MRDSRLVLASGAVQWLGLGLAGLVAIPEGTLILTRAGIVELVTALVCVALLAITLLSIPRSKWKEARGPTAVDYLLTGLAIVVGGVGGLILAAQVPLSGLGQIDTAFYWAALSGALALGFEGASSPVKLTMGLFAVLNAAALLVFLLHITAPGPGLLALMSLSRVGFALLLAVLWNWLAASYGRLTLDPLFGKQQAVTSTELMPLSAPDEEPEPRPGVLVGPAIESDHTEEERLDTE